MMKRKPRAGQSSEAAVRLEPFIFLGIILLVWLVGSTGRWLRQEFERQSSNLQESDLPADSVECPPSPDCGSVTPEEATHGVQEEAIAVPHIVSEERRPRHTSSRFRYHNPQAMRDGIVMMAVFGSCKALDRRREPWLRDG